MPEAEYGKYILYISLYGITSSVASVPISAGVIYNLFSREDAENSAAAICGFLISVPVNLIICALLFAFSPFLEISTKVIPILFLHVLLDNIISASLLKSRFSYEATRVLFIEIFKSLISSLIAIFLVSRLSLGYLGRVYAFVVTLIPFAVLSLARLLKSSARIKGSLFTGVVSNAAPSILSTLFLSAGIYSVNILVSALLGEEALASFSIFNTLATSPIFVISALISALAPYIQSCVSRSAYPPIFRAHSLCAGGLSALVMLIALISPECFNFLAPTGYGENPFILLPLLIYVLLKFSDQFLTALLNAKKSYKRVMISNFLFSLTCISMLFVLLFSLGLIATGCALSIATLISVSYKSYSLREVIGCSFSAFDILLPLGQAIAVCALAISLSARPEIRILLAIFPAVKLLNLYFGEGRLLLGNNG